jgi:peptide/nickel transport system permease protein
VWLLLAGVAGWGLALPWAGAGLLAAGLAAGVVGLIGKRRKSRRGLPAWPLPLDGMVLGAAALLGSVPRLVLVVAVAGTGISYLGLLGLLAATSWTDAARLVRAQMLRVRALPFAEAAVAAGLPAGRVWWRHALPHALQPLRAAFPLSVAGLVGLETTLSFLGIGLPPEIPSWGRLLNSVRLEMDAWWLAVFPAGALLATVLALQLLARTRPR